MVVFHSYVNVYQRVNGVPQNGGPKHMAQFSSSKKSFLSRDEASETIQKMLDEKGFTVRMDGHVMTLPAGARVLALEARFQELPGSRSHLGRSELQKPVDRGNR